MQFVKKEKNSSKLIVFFSGWGCDENQFENLKDKDDVLILYDYENIDLDFDFSKYEEANLIAYSAGVFVSSVLQKKLPRFKKRVAVNGNPFLFDERLGLSAEKVKVFREISLENYLVFRREYMVETDSEYEQFNKLQSVRSIESCQRELTALQELYEKEQKNIQPEFDKAIISDHDLLFDLAEQKKFYRDKIKVYPDTKHHLFFHFNSFAEILDY